MPPSIPPATPDTTVDVRSRLGKVMLMGSGETAASGRRMHHLLFEQLPGPVRVAILETPAGFELNSSAVAGRVGDFLAERLTNFHPQISVIPARRRDGPFSTDNAEALAPMLEANYIFAGAGSPTYAVRHLKNTRAYEYLVGRHRHGATICLASAAVIAFSAKTVPVYEIYKAGIDPYWEDGLDFFGTFGLNLAMISHWDNNEGGETVDTSHCFTGRARMEPMRRMLAPGARVLGLDEHTGVLFNFQTEQCEVMGRGGLAILEPGKMQVFESGASFPFSTLGPYHTPAEGPLHGVAVGAEERDPTMETEPTAEVLALIQRREEARRARNWAEADRLRGEIAAQGFEVKDTRDGFQLRYTGSGN
jgi:cyanophycinase-like exopeptidase